MITLALCIPKKINCQNIIFHPNGFNPTTKDKVFAVGLTTPSLESDLKITPNKGLKFGCS
jgi:hypothetical protein